MTNLSTYWGIPLPSYFQLLNSILFCFHESQKVWIGVIHAPPSGPGCWWTLAGRDGDSLAFWLRCGWNTGWPSVFKWQLIHSITMIFHAAPYNVFAKYALKKWKHISWNTSAVFIYGKLYYGYPFIYSMCVNRTVKLCSGIWAIPFSMTLYDVLFGQVSCLCILKPIKLCF